MTFSPKLDITIEYTFIIILLIFTVNFYCKVNLEFTNFYKCKKIFTFIKIREF